MSTPLRVLDAGVTWHDGAANDPSLCFLVDRRPVWDVYEKRPCVAERLSAEQAAIVGTRVRDDREGWHLYWSEDDGFAWFFTWGGKPDNGFGRYRRTLTLSDGTTEEVIGGWHTGGEAATELGYPSLVDVSYRTDYSTVRGREPRLVGGTACFITEERFAREVDKHLPDCEVVVGRFGGLTVKWRGQPSKSEFMEAEQARTNGVREALIAKYGGEDNWPRNGDWYRRATEEERALLAVKPYSALGATA